MIYLDHAATTPLHPDVLEAMLPHMHDNWGNPSSPHAAGRRARQAIDDSRQTVARLCGVKPQEVVFVSSGSEGNSLALLGVTEQWMKTHNTPGHLLLLSIEHDCSLQAVDKLVERGWDVELLPVTADGLLESDTLRRALRDDTALVSVQWANNEIGTIQPIEEVLSICRERKIPYHCDAVQPVGQLPFPADVPDLVTMAAHKFYGPKGIGVLIVRDHMEIVPQILGGGQEFGMRAGTENTAGIVGLAAALTFATEEQASEYTRLTTLRDDLIAQLTAIDGVTLNGDAVKRLPNNVNVHVNCISADTLVIQMDMRGICISAGSACATGSMKTSHVGKAIGQSDIDAGRNLRITLGRSTTIEDINTCARELADVIENLRG